MGKFYVRIEESVEGPFAPHLLRYLPGFNEETLVSPEDLSTADWVKALNVPEIKPHLKRPEGPLPAINQPSAAEQQSLPPPQTFPTPAQRPPQDEQAAGTDQELLDVINQFSGQIPLTEPAKEAQAAVRPAQPRIPAVSNDGSTIVPPLEEKYVPKRTKKRRKIFAGVGLAVVLVGAIGYMAFVMGMLDRWKLLFAAFLNKNEPAPVVQLPSPAPMAPAPPLEIKPAAPRPPAKKVVKEAQKKPAAKAKAKSPAAAPRAKPVKEEPLKMQKYVMPGVPSPKVVEEKKPEAKSPEAPPPEAAQPQAAQNPDDEFEKELKKSKARQEKESKKKKKPAADDDYFEFQWISADPGEKD